MSVEDTKKIAELMLLRAEEALQAFESGNGFKVSAQSV